MPTEAAKKGERKISIDELVVGMFVAGLDISWLKTPFLFHKRLIRQREDIALLKEYGVQIVTIDPNRGKDVPNPDIPHNKDNTECTPTTLGLDPTPIPESELNASVEQTRSLSYEEARTVRAEATVAVQKIFEGVKNGTPIDGPATKNVVDKLLHNILDSQDHFLHLLHMRDYDVNLYTHAVDVCSLALVNAHLNGFSDAKLQRLGVGALLHDIGHMRLPRNVLRKQGTQTEHERKLFEVHPALGVTLLSRSSGIHEESIDIVAEHHERCNGSGYPNHRRAPDISEMTQIVGIADMYDALLSSRHGRIPLQPSEAIRQLYQLGIAGEFDMKLVRTAISYLGAYPADDPLALTASKQIATDGQQGELYATPITAGHTGGRDGEADPSAGGSLELVNAGMEHETTATLAGPIEKPK